MGGTALSDFSPALQRWIMETGVRAPIFVRDSILARLRVLGVVQWSALPRIGRISLAGVLASGVLAIALGVTIPRAAQDRILGAELDSVAALVGVLEAQKTIPSMDRALTGTSYRRFDNIVQGGLLGGQNLRVKLWNMEGRIIYSDMDSLVGRRFPLTDDLEAALAGLPSAEVSDLSAKENSFDRGLGIKLLEFYVPVHGSSGEVVGAFEIYQDYRPLEGRLASIKRVVWVSVAGGLALLFVFLWFLFMGTAAAIAKEKHAAEERAAALKEVTDSRGRLLRRMVRVQEEERRHLVGDLHDGLGQALTRVLYGLRGCKLRLGNESQIAEELGHLESLVDEQARDLRRYMARIKPALLADKGLGPALEAFAQDQELEAGFPIEVDVSGVAHLEDGAEVTLFRAAQESVMNARKHANASRITISLAQEGHWLDLVVADDGRGASLFREGMGLSYMRDRVASLGGTVDIESRAGSGTTVRVRVPEGDHA